MLQQLYITQSDSLSSVWNPCFSLVQIHCLTFDLTPAAFFHQKQLRAHETATEHCVFTARAPGVEKTRVCGLLAAVRGPCSGGWLYRRSTDRRREGMASRWLKTTPASVRRPDRSRPRTTTVVARVDMVVAFPPCKFSLARVLNCFTSPRLVTLIAAGLVEGESSRMGLFAYKIRCPKRLFRSFSSIMPRSTA
jgi:hypothetical protein